MPELSDKEQYEQAAKFLQLPRCVQCFHYQTGGQSAQCTKLSQEIPLEYLYTPNECADFDNCPF